ncbi:MAG: septal ring lytic transglycosylase RlpA family protein [Alphaproteobacteria bacterium]|nr:MAG: septal ring lytic transglycosylase RlpA family protein [Alphaproteobacteria bacterium]
MIRNIVVVAALVGVLASTTGAFAGDQCGGASWYSLPGNRTASGDRMNPSAMTAAHKSLPFGTKVRVVDQRSGKSISVTINDRGPFVKGRIIDLSKAAATKLGFRNAGHTKVCIERV